MKLTVNGKTEEIDQVMTVLEYIRFKGIDPRTVVVQKNGEVIKRDHWEKEVVRENDRLEILRMVGGGSF